MIGRRARLLSVGLGAGLVTLAACAAFSASAAAAPPQVTVYLGGYGQPHPQSSSQVGPASSAQSAPASAASLQQQAAFAQGVAYERYLQYVAAVQASRMAPGDATQYFTNGASLMTVPSSGPGSAYFANGAEPARPATQAAATPPPIPPAPPSPPSGAPLAPYWWVESAPPPPAPPASAAPALPPAPTEPPPADERPTEETMSFEEWLQSMGADAPESATEVEQEPLATDTAAPETAPALVEPAAAAYEIRERAPSASREKLRERVQPSTSSNQPLVLMLGTFAAGLALGALAMKRGSVRARTEP